MQVKNYELFLSLKCMINKNNDHILNKFPLQTITQKLPISSNKNLL